MLNNNNNSKPKWDSPIAFLMAMVGAAVGLGNIWRFSYVLYSNGGGSFFIPYFCAIFLMGIPFLILEYGIGYKFKDSFSNILKKIKPKFEIIGWILLLFVFIVCCYYLVIIAWDLIYFIGSFTQAWGTNPAAFFTNYVGGGNNLANGGTIFVSTLIAIIAIWISLWYISHKSVDEGIGKFSKVLIPLLFVIMGIIIVYSFTLPGHEIGINALLKPDWSSLLNIQIWLAAFAQIVFSLSMGQAIAITYAGYLDKDARLNDYVLLVVSSNSGFEICTAFGIFSILGFMSLSTGLPINELITQGTSLIFIVFPTIFNTMGVVGHILAPLLFLSILFAGITSGLGFFEPINKAISDKLDWDREKTVKVLCLFGFCISACFATGIGSYLVEIVDSFVNEFGILILIALQCILFGWIYGIDNLIDIVNNYSHFKVGKLWTLIIKYVLPILLVSMWGYGIIQLVQTMNFFQIIVDLVLVIGVFVTAVFLTKYKPKLKST